jgi:hypothetical protein
VQTFTNSPYGLVELHDCLFYHSFDFPDGTSVVGEWDMRGQFADYIGHVPMQGKTVCDVGTASGFLTFEAEKAGARVTSFDADSTARYTPLPHLRGMLHTSRTTKQAEQESWLTAVKKSYWFSHTKYSSSTRAIYGDVFELAKIGQFDCVILGQILVHNKSPIDIIAAAAQACKQDLIITEGMWEIQEPALRFLGGADRPEDYFSWWLASPAWYIEIARMLGFELAAQSNADFNCNHATHAGRQSLHTMVFRRVLNGG